VIVRLPLRRWLLSLELFATTWCCAWLGSDSEKRDVTMDSVLHRIIVGVRSLRAFIAASLRKSIGMEAHVGDFASQRMCPFCGLITPRYETRCLECGRTLKPA